MKDAGINPPIWHNRLKKLPKGENLMLFLNSEGILIELQRLQYDRTKELRKYGTNQGTFPAFNIELEIEDDDKESKKELGKLLQKAEEHVPEIIALLDRKATFSKTKAGQDRGILKINSCLKTVASELLEKVGNSPDEYKALEELINRASKVTRDGFLRQFKDRIFEKIQNNPSETSTWVQFLIQSDNVILEVDASYDSKYPVNNINTLRWINSRLLGTVEKTPRTKSLDAYAKPVDMKKANKDKLPQVNLPKIGRITIRQMFEAKPCQSRYAKIGSASFPIGHEARNEMAAALEWLAKEQKIGKTWANVAGVSGHGNGLLFAYPSALSEPEDQPEYAGIFAPEDNASDADGVNFEAAAARVLPSIHGIVKNTPNAEMRIFVLVKPHGIKATTAKLLFSERYELSRLPSAAEEWKNGCGNIPLLLAEPSTPFPSEVVKCLNCEWIRDGTEMADVHGLGIGEGIKLLMETENYAKPIIERALNLAVKNSTPLLLGYAHEIHKEIHNKEKVKSKDYKLPGKGWVRKANKDKNFKAVHQVNLVPPILGLLLFKQNINKEDYMNNAPFLVGKFLSLVDLLHKEYCSIVRGAIPNQLIGNAMMRTALIDPQKAMSQLSDRLPVYYNWGNTVEFSEKTRKTKWALGQINKVSNEISKVDYPERMRDAEKAQLLLGYLAREPKEVDQDNENTNENKTN